MQYRFIEPEQTRELRHLILRPNEPRENCVYAGDSVAGAFHVGAFDDQNGIVGVVSLGPEKSELFTEKLQYRLRGMAVRPEFRRRRVGAKLVEFAMTELENKNVDIVWFNARKVAYEFYKTLGFEFCSNEFEIDGIGLHKVMFSKVKGWSGGSSR